MKNDDAGQSLDEPKEALIRQRQRLMYAFGFGMVANLLVLAPTAYMFEVYDRVVNSRNATTLVMLTVFVLFALAIMEALEWSRSETLREAGDGFERDLMPRVYRAVFQMNLVRPGSATTQPIQDLRVVKDFFHSPAVAALPELPAAIIFLVLLFALSPWLGVLALVTALLQVGLTWANERQTQPALAQANRLHVAAQQQADAMLRHAEVVKAMGMRPSLHQRWLELQQKVLYQQALASDRAGIFQSFTRLLQTLLSSTLLGMGAWLVLQDALWGGAGMLVVGSVLGGRILAPLSQAVAQWRSVVNARESWKRLNRLLHSSPPLEPGMPLPPPIGRLTVEALAASAPGMGTPILRGVQFSLQPGEVLAVVGPSASGKSTLARLLVGIWPPLAGKVRLNGVDVFTWNKQELGPHLGYLPQSVELLDGTIADNIARFGPSNPAATQAAARAVGLHEWIQSLPQGYDTPLGADGTRLSGGQRQRVGLARALYGNPSLVVLDEPNASLDASGEAELIQVVTQRQTEGTTFVLVTHRLNVLQACTHMLVLHEGTQQLFGRTAEVMAALNAAANKSPPKQGAAA